MEPLIVEVIHRWFPDWQPPYNNGREWISCRCPFHGDSSPSAAVSFTRNAFKCFACPVKGDVISLLQEREGVSSAEAFRIAKEVSQDGNGNVLVKPAGVTRGSVFSEKGFRIPERETASRQVHAGVRPRSSPWA